MVNVDSLFSYFIKLDTKGSRRRCHGREGGNETESSYGRSSQVFQYFFQFGDFETFTTEPNFSGFKALERIL